MLKRRRSDGEPVTLTPEPLAGAPVSRASTQLFIDHLRRGAKPAEQWMCGLEFELFGYAESSLRRLDAEQVRAVLSGLASTGGVPLSDGGLITAALLDEEHGGGQVTVEPGGQVEYSGAPRPALAEIERDVRAYLARLGAIARESGFIFLATGFDPVRSREEQQWFPKPRYRIMRPYLATRGLRAWDMMCRTCAIQVNVDYDSDEDLAKKFVLGNRLGPIVTAIFAGSPFETGAPSGYKSTRAAAWLETDTDRAGVSPLACTDHFSLAAFVEYACSVPMLFARRDGGYTDATTGLGFGAFLDGGGGVVRPVFQDWSDHLTTIFTEARLKQYIELRSADCGGFALTMALQALWKGLMYDPEALDEAFKLAPKLSMGEARALQECVAREGLAARTGGVNVLGLSKELVRLAAAGLQRIAPAESGYLDVLAEQVIEDEVCPADILLRNWHGRWHGSVARLVEYLRIA
ncbi:MAG TPA: glutamate-cysteine ligase family protein [Pyrinomonadaceae bacterium]